MNELVSVIIPCYNGEKFIERAINSVMTQDYENIELIVVDDGSVDNSKIIILDLKTKFDNANRVLNYVFQNNKGLAGAINTGLKYVTGVYLSLLDADDEYLPGSISERVEYLNCHVETSIVRSNGYIVDGDKKRLFVTDDAEKNEKDVFTALICGKTNNWAGSYMLRTKELFEFYPDREIYQSRYGQNLQLMLPLLYKKSCGFIDKPHMNYIHQPESLSQSINKDERLEKELKNAKGYSEIREVLVSAIVKDSKEKDTFLKSVNKFYYESLFRIAFLHKEKVLMKDILNNHKEINNIDNRILYYSIICKPYSLCLRFLRKLRIVK